MITYTYDDDESPVIWVKFASNLSFAGPEATSKNDMDWMLPLADYLEYEP
jgi:hypothetical protein